MIREIFWSRLPGQVSSTFYTTPLYTAIPNVGNEWQQASNDASCPIVTDEMVLYPATVVTA